jgi:hypothetical protein
MANAAAQGRTGTPFTVEIERGKILEFAAATRSHNPGYWDSPNPVVPPTFLTTQMFWQAWAGESANPWHAVELNQQRGMHAEQEYEFFGPPPRAGDRLTATSRIGRVYDKPGRRGGLLTFAEMITEFRDAEGRLVAKATMTGVETAHAPQDDAVEVAGGSSS